MSELFIAMIACRKEILPWTPNPMSHVAMWYEGTICIFDRKILCLSLIFSAFITLGFGAGILESIVFGRNQYL